MTENCIRAERARLNMTQPDLAIKVGVSIQTIQNWEADIGTCSIKNLLKLAQLRKYRYGVVACHDGTVYKYGVGNERISAYIIDKTVKKYQELVDETGKRLYTEIEAHLAALDELKKGYGIWYEVWRPLL